MSKKYAERSRSNGNYKTGTVEVDVEQLMQEIDRRAEQQRQSLPANNTVAITPRTAQVERFAAEAEQHDHAGSGPGMERRLHEALKAQIALNASIVDSLARLDQAHRGAQSLQTALSQKLALYERVQPQLADEVAGLREEVDRLEETTERLRRSSLGLLSLVQQIREQVTSEPDRLEARLQALEQAVRMLVARQQEMGGQHE